MLKKKIFYVLSFFINLILFLNNLLIIFYNIRLINKTEILIFQNERIGFGNIFTSIDLARKIFKKKKILFISFYDETRYHNKKIFDFLLEKKIILYTSIYINLIKKRIGEYDQYGYNRKNNKFQLILIKLICLLKRNAKKYTIPELYKFAESKVKHIKKKKYIFLSENHKWLTYYYYLVEKKPYIKINNDILLIKNINKNINGKSICIYKREKKFINKYTKNYLLFKKLIKILYFKKYKIYLTGEYTNLIKYYPEITRLVTLPETNSIFSKELNLAFQIACNYYIGDCGGGSYFSMYKHKSMILGNSLGNKFPNKVKVFNYKIYNKNSKNNVLIKKIINRQIIINKASLDPYLLSKLKFKISVDENKIIKYVKRNF
jgi:hypothetical protein